MKIKYEHSFTETYFQNVTGTTFIKWILLVDSSFGCDQGVAQGVIPLYDEQILGIYCAGSNSRIPKYNVIIVLVRVCKQLIFCS